MKSVDEILAEDRVATKWAAVIVLIVGIIILLIGIAMLRTSVDNWSLGVSVVGGIMIGVAVWNLYGLWNRPQKN